MFGVGEGGAVGNVAGMAGRAQLLLFEKMLWDVTNNDLDNSATFLCSCSVLSALNGLYP